MVVSKKKTNKSKKNTTTKYGNPRRKNRKSTQSTRNKRNKSNKIKVIIAKRVLSDDYIKNKEGEYFDEKHYDKIVNRNCDVYYYEDGEKKTLLKFRKHAIPEKLCQIGLECLKDAAKKTHDNRGAAAGVIDLKKMPTYANTEDQLIGKSKFRVLAYRSKITNKIVKNTLGNISQSNIIGYFDKRDRNLDITAPPCRTTAFTSQQVEKWDKVIPLIQNIDSHFKRLTPKNHRIQYKKANDTNFVIKGTSFSTVTINYNWRTALHRDAGDLKEGFGNLVVLQEGDYKGGCTGFPQFKVAVDCKHGDFLAMDVHEWHCNTKIHPISKDYVRLSLVAYLREKMAKCKGRKL